MMTERKRQISAAASVVEPERRWLRAVLLAGAGIAALALVAGLVLRSGTPGPSVPLATQQPAAQMFMVEGQAMAPNYVKGQVVAVEPVDGAALRRGDVVLVDRSGQTFLKRVIGLPGDTISIHERRVYLNGVQLEESYARGAETTCRQGDPCDQGQPIAIPAGSIFVLGDNRSNSADSREFGPIPVSQVRGRVR
jgi:signal peptidase I